MKTTYVQKTSTVQKADNSKAVSILDASSQSESLQRKADMANNAAQREDAPRPNNTGMPDNLKSGIESLSGFSMDDVRVHYNSSKPATVQALAYTQGTDIHVAPGQEKYLPHEAWHVAQQMAGRVSPTTNINGMPVNDNAGLEHEADVMGEKAAMQRMAEGQRSFHQPKNLKNISQLIGARWKKKGTETTLESTTALTYRDICDFILYPIDCTADSIIVKEQFTRAELIRDLIQDIPVAEGSLSKDEYGWIDISLCDSYKSLKETMQQTLRERRTLDTQDFDNGVDEITVGQITFRIDQALQGQMSLNCWKAFRHALSNGIVGDTNQIGIKKDTKRGYKLKILGAYGDSRLFGNFTNETTFTFNIFEPHAH